MKLDADNTYYFETEEFGMVKVMPTSYAENESTPVLLVSYKYLHDLLNKDLKDKE
jgi:hypothetical protein